MTLRRHFLAILGLLTAVSVPAVADPTDDRPAASADAPPADATAAPKAPDDAPKAAATSDVLAGAGRINSVEIQFRRLGDMLAEGIGTRPGGGRYDRWAVMPFTELGPEVERHELGLLSTTRMEAVLTTDHQFISVDRQHLMEVVRERQLMHVLVFEEGKIRQVGHALGADVLVSGSVGMTGGRYVINVRAANVATGKVMAIARAEIDRNSFNKAAADQVFRTRVYAALKSAALPGWGQWSNHDRVKSGIVFVGSLALFGIGLRYSIVGFEAESRYAAINSTTPGNCLSVVSEQGPWLKCLHNEEHYAVMNYQMANKFYAGLGGLYLLNIADAFIFGRNPDAAKSLAPSFSVGGHALSFDVQSQGLTVVASF